MHACVYVNVHTHVNVYVTVHIHVHIFCDIVAVDSCLRVRRSEKEVRRKVHRPASWASLVTMPEWCHKKKNKKGDKGRQIRRLLKQCSFIFYATSFLARFLELLLCYAIS